MIYVAIAGLGLLLIGVPVAFALGTALTFAKELIRLAMVERTLRGTSHLVRGLRDGRAISRDERWMPMPTLERAAT